MERIPSILIRTAVNKISHCSTHYPNKSLPYQDPCALPPSHFCSVNDPPQTTNSANKLLRSGFGTSKNFSIASSFSSNSLSIRLSISRVYAKLAVLSSRCLSTILFISGSKPLAPRRLRMPVIWAFSVGELCCMLSMKGSEIWPAFRSSREHFCWVYCFPRR